MNEKPEIDTRSMAWFVAVIAAVLLAAFISAYTESAQVKDESWEEFWDREDRATEQDRQRNETFRETEERHAAELVEIQLREAMARQAGDH